MGVLDQQTAGNIHYATNFVSAVKSGDVNHITNALAEKNVINQNTAKQIQSANTLATAVKTGNINQIANTLLDNNLIDADTAAKVKTANGFVSAIKTGDVNQLTQSLYQSNFIDKTTANNITTVNTIANAVNDGNVSQIATALSQNNIIDGKTADNVMRLSNYYDSAKQHKNKIEQMIQTKNFDVQAANDAYQFMMTGTNGGTGINNRAGQSNAYNPGFVTQGFVPISSFSGGQIPENNTISTSTSFQINNNRTQGKLDPKRLLSNIESTLNRAPSKQAFEAIAGNLGTPQVHEFLQYKYPLGIEQSKNVDQLLNEYKNLNWSDKASVGRFTSNYKDLDDDVVRLHFLSRSTGGGKPIHAGGQLIEPDKSIGEMPLLWARDLSILGFPSRAIGHVNAIEQGVRAYSQEGKPLYVNPRSHEYVTQEGVGVELASIAAGGAGTRFRVGSVTRVKIPHSQEWFEEVARKATRNPDSDKLVLGHFAKEGSTYQKVASHYKATYFKVEGWNKVTKGMSTDEIWKINKTFLDQQLKKGKRILLSHDPSKARPSSFYEKEINRLRNLGYNFKQINQWTWEAVK